MFWKKNKRVETLEQKEERINSDEREQHTSNNIFIDMLLKRDFVFSLQIGTDEDGNKQTKFDVKVLK